MATELAGVQELNIKLSKLERSVGIKTLRSAVFKSTTPVVRAMKSKIPVGSRAHRTYRKRLVAPGFSKRSIKRLTGKKYINQGKLSIAIGVKAEAFYAINFIDQGPHKVTKRGRRPVKSYTINQHPWFQSTFLANKNLMLRTFRSELQIAIEKAAR